MEPQAQRKLLALLLALVACLAGARVAIGHDGKSMLEAVESGQIAAVKAALAAGVSPNHVVSGFGTALQVAVDNERSEIVALLISGGADPDKTTEDDDRTPLHIAVGTGNLEIIEQLLRGKAAVDKRDARGQSPLFVAIQNGDLPAFTALIERGADINVSDQAGTTPLVATIVGKREMARLLLARGARIDGERIARTRCGGCHGASGEGAPDGKATPPLAGQHRDYLAKQLGDYLSRARLDVRMNRYVSAMNAEVIAAISAFFSAQAGPARLKERNPDAVKAGAGLYATGVIGGDEANCASCHGRDGVSTRNELTPRIAGMDSMYLEVQLRAFRDGKRTNDPDGVMRSAMRGWTNDQIVSVSAYIQSLQPPR
ncbi:MAG: ankyrin repeat domain-containing protein [Burkholderiaceae bacterium]